MTIRWIFALVFSCIITWIPLGSVVVAGQQDQDSSLDAHSLSILEEKAQINAPAIKMTAPGVYEIGSIRIVKKENRIEFPATVNMNKSLIEYLLVSNGGKLHESLLKTNVDPYSIQVALLLLGLEGTTNPLREQGEKRTPEGTPVSIRVETKQANAKKTAALEEWIVLVEKSGATRKPKLLDWVFTGSFINNGVFMAQVEKSIAALYHDPAAIIDNILPEGANDEVWFVNEKTVPPVGTEVKVIIEGAKRRVK